MYAKFSKIHGHNYEINLFPYAYLLCKKQKINIVKF